MELRVNPLLGLLFVDGKKYKLTIREMMVAAPLVRGEIVIEKKPRHQESLRGLILKLRRKTPLKIVNIGLKRGYALENFMADHTKTRPVIDQALSNIKGVFKEPEAQGIIVGPRSYDPETGTGEITGKGKTADGEYEFKIKITPREIEETGDG